MTVHDYSARSLDGAELQLSDFKDQALLVVNTASQCGFTPQYAGLEQLHRTYKDRGFHVLGFPCNQFGAQEPGDAAEIRHFCTLKYDVSFPMFAKVDVNGPGAHPLWLYLKDSRRGLFGAKRIMWNFTKFLVDRQGRVVRRFGPATKPGDLGPAIERLL